MSFRRTDQGKIIWPKGISSEDRRFCRDLYTNLIYHDTIRVPHSYGCLGLKQGNQVVIACSGGLDSTVLSHAFVQRTIIRPKLNDNPITTTLVYVNHNLRPNDETNQDTKHVQTLAKSLGVQHQVASVRVQEGNVQAQAREARYDALALIARQKQYASVYLAHHVNDVAETKLFQFLTGRPVIGIHRTHIRNRVVFSRPLIEFTREDLLRYASIWKLGWSEDSTNATDKYTRNRIRHDLIPWIEKEINPGIVKMLGKTKDI